MRNSSFPRSSWKKVTVTASVFAALMITSLITSSDAHASKRSERKRLEHELQVLQEGQKGLRSAIRDQERLVSQEKRNADIGTCSDTCTPARYDADSGEQIGGYDNCSEKELKALRISVSGSAVCITIFDKVTQSGKNIGGLSLLSGPCREAVEGCAYPAVLEELLRQKADLKSNEETIASTKDELNELNGYDEEEFENCPQCQLIKAMTPERTTGDRVVAGIQAVMPGVLGGLNAWMYSRGIKESANQYTNYLDAYSQQLEQCKMIGIPCDGPLPFGAFGSSGFGGGMGMMGGGFGMYGGGMGMGGGFASIVGGGFMPVTMGGGFGIGGGFSMGGGFSPMYGGGFGIGGGFSPMYGGGFGSFSMPGWAVPIAPVPPLAGFGMGGGFGIGGGFSMGGGFSPMYGGGFGIGGGFSMGGGFSPMYGGGFSPMMGGGFSPMYGGGFGIGGGFGPVAFGGGFSPMMGGGFSPMMGSAFSGGFSPGFSGGYFGSYGSNPQYQAMMQQQLISQQMASQRAMQAQQNMMQQQMRIYQLQMELQQSWMGYQTGFGNSFGSMGGGYSGTTPGGGGPF